ncbi:PAS domain S-box protein [Piscinibacter sp. XHJ-5]|uniref:PAS domain S-box protein n=1 Tax=Piscinibacter sp. XHJ-5 TaxID=3037797 RepID=UPI002452D0C8|nr:PAS domain S-box protein [Piscinibacter sp. XHJ-5]
MTSNRVPHGSDARDLGERRRLEKALQASDERFRTLVQMSFDVYWETDAEHRFTRQDFAPTLLNAPAPGSELGKTRWDVPYLEPDEEAWRRHRATLAAHLPFRDFELARPTAGGGTRHVSVSGFPVFDEGGRFLGYRGVGRDITQRKRAEAQHSAHLWFLQSMDRISRAMQGTRDLEPMIRDVLETTIDVFSCDRAWLLHPCDQQLATWRADMERTRPPFPAAFASDTDVAGDADMSAAFTAAQASGDPVLVLPAPLADRYGIRSHMAMALQPKEDHPYLFCVHQCSQARSWTDDEQRLFREIGGRLADALSSLLAIRNLRDSERRLEAAQRIAHVGWWERDYRTGNVALSDEASRIFGVEPVDMPQWHGRWLSLIHPDDRAHAASASEEALRGGARYDVEYRVVRPDGTLRMVHSQGDVTWDESGRPIRQFGVMQDITELWRAEQELRARQDMLELAQKAARAVAFDWYIGARESENRWSPELEAMYGLAPGQFDRTFRGWKKLVHPDDWPAVKLAVQQANESGDVAAEYRVMHNDGTVHWLQAKGRMLFDAEGRPDRMIGFMIDVTERRHAEEELRATEARFRTFVDHATDAFFLHADDSTVIDVNQQACVSLGYGREELIGMHPRQFDAGLDRPSLARIMERIGKGEPVTFETLHRRSDGTVFPVEVRVRRFLHGEKRLFASLVRDTSERKRAEEELRASEARFRTFVDRATDAFFLLDDKSTVIDVNRQACVGLGYERDELIGMHPRDFDVALDEQSISRLAARAGAGETITFETRHRRRDGTVFPVEIRSGMFRQGDRMFYLALARDITERKLAEERLRQQDDALQTARAQLAHVSRLTTLGELTSSIAHEVSQPLGAMITSAGACARWLAAQPPDIAEARAALDNIAADGKRARDVIARIRALTKRQVVRKDSLDLNRELLEVLALTEHESRSHGIVRRTELEWTLPRVPGDRIQLQQVLLNLIVNAIEAMSAVGDRPRLLTIVSRHDSPDVVLVEVRDTGSGLDPQRIEQMFEAFYTTKADGIGIGLSISRSIVEAHGGRLGASPNEPHGAVFRLTLPVATAQEPEAVRPEDAP